MFRKSIIFLLTIFSISCFNPNDNISGIIENPNASSKPWVFWYWRKAAVSKPGITRDLMEMKKQGIGGAYLIPLQGKENPPLFEPVAEQLTPHWWTLIKHALKTADSLHLKIAMHACDGFAVAGGPWITPELSMQKLVWTDTVVNGGKASRLKIRKPHHYKNYYEDIAVFAFPTPENYNVSTREIKPVVTTSMDDADADFLADPRNDERLRSEDSCWIKYEFEKAFTCNSIEIITKGNNLQSHRFLIEASDDGIQFKRICRLEPPRNGWQDYDAPITHAIPTTTARFFRFTFNPEGTEPGSEDYDAAKWKQILKVSGIVLSGKSIINQFESKNGEIWRISKHSNETFLSESQCIPLEQMVDITKNMDSSGNLSFDMPAGNWTILRIGHTSTGHTNYIGGGGLGLECDKFNPKAAKLQFDNWFGKIFDQAGPELAARVLKIFHTDSWEVSSQNWSPVFRGEFLKRRGYDLYSFLPIMTGLPVNNAEFSERFLKDVRTTIEELVAVNFFGVMADLARKKGCIYSAESIAPTFVSDAMLHYNQVDMPMGEFWHNSPTHDKPNDMLDAISAGHIYGKKIIQAEAFTTLRMEWNEHPGMLKTLLDRNYALGMNKICYHVFCENPWMDRKPGMTLDGVGLYFQPDQTWWEQGREWINYSTRCQALLQWGVPVADIAVYTGEETPRRALTPDRLVPFLTGLFDNEKIEEESERLINNGIPYQEKPVGVTNTLHTYNPANWIDPLNGYHFDSFNKDALLHLANVKDGKVVVPGGAEYSVLVIPGKRRMNPNGNAMSFEVVQKLEEMARQGVTIIWYELPDKTTGLHHQNDDGMRLKELVNSIKNAPKIDGENVSYIKYGKGKILTGAYLQPSLEPVGIERDLKISGTNSNPNIAWNHRHDKYSDIYFISNQDDTIHFLDLDFRMNGYGPEIYFPAENRWLTTKSWIIRNNRTIIPVKMEAHESFFVIFRNKTSISNKQNGNNYITTTTIDTLETEWLLKFSKDAGGPESPVKVKHLKSWTTFQEDGIKYYSGTVQYNTSFDISNNMMLKNNLFLVFEKIENMATIYVNGKECGTLWTKPYRLNILPYLEKGTNELEIHVTNTWANRIMGDALLPEEKRITWTTAPYRLKDKALNDAGIIGNVYLATEVQD